MRTRRGTRCNGAACLTLALAPLFAESAQGQQLTWDASGASPTAATDGSGTWSTTVANWTDGLANTVWVNGDFGAIGNGGTPGTITIDDPSGSVTAAGIQFNPVSSGGYTIAANGSNTLNLVSGASLNFAAGASATISAPISGSVGLTIGGGTLNLTGHNTFTGVVQINSGTLITNASDSLGATANIVSLGTPNTGTSTNDPIGALVVGSTATIGGFRNATNNAATNTVNINSGVTLNVRSNSPLSGLNSTVNGAFIVGTPNALGAMTTKLTISGAATLNVDGGSNNSSFLVALGNCNSSNPAFNGTALLDMSGLSNFSFTTGTGAIPSGGGNEFAIGHGAGDAATATLAVNSTIVAGTVTVGDQSVTPGLTGGGPNSPNNNNILNLGSGVNTISTNNIVIGAGRAQGTVQWNSATTTGSLVVSGAAGGSSTANLTIGSYTAGTAPSSASALTLSGHSVTFHAGTVVLGNQNGATGGSATSGRGGRIDFDTGEFDIVDLIMAVATSGTGSGPINGTFALGASQNSTGSLNVTHSFLIASNISSGVSPSKGTFQIKGGTANISCNIIDNSTTNTSLTTLSMSGGTLNMNGFAIGTTAPLTGGKRPIATISFTGTNAVLANLGGDGINSSGLTLNSTILPAGAVLTLESSNGYTGGTTISGAGTLQVGQNGDTVAITTPLGAGGVTNNGNLQFGSSNAVNVPNVISGTGVLSQNGTGSTTLAANNTYTGVTSVNNGTLRVGNVTNGGINGPLGGATSAAGNLLISGGTLQYTGSGASTDRLFTVTATGGAVDSSGSGALVFNNGGAVLSADPATRNATLSTTSNKLTLPSVADLVVGMPVSSGVGSILAGTTIIAINPNANSITLSSTPTFAGAATVAFGTANRTLTLTGTNAAANTLGNSLSDSAGGGTLSLTKSGSGAWTLTTSNSYTGVTTVQGGMLTAVGSAAWGPALAKSNITGGRLVFDYSSDASPAGTISTALMNSYASNFTTGPLQSSAATTTKGLGWKDDAGSKKVTVMLTYFGDSNLDGQVNTADFTTLAQNFNAAGVWASGDFNYDGVVNALDFNAVATNFGAAALPATSLGTLVPEPASIGLLVMASGLCSRRRRR